MYDPSASLADSVEDMLPDLRLLPPVVKYCRPAFGGGSDIPSTDIPPFDDDEFDAVEQALSTADPDVVDPDLGTFCALKPPLCEFFRLITFRRRRSAGTLVEGILES